MINELIKTNLYNKEYFIKELVPYGVESPIQNFCISTNYKRTKFIKEILNIEIESTSFFFSENRLSPMIKLSLFFDKNSELPTVKLDNKLNINKTFAVLPLNELNKVNYKNFKEDLRNLYFGYAIIVNDDLESCFIVNDFKNFIDFKLFIKALQCKYNIQSCYLQNEKRKTFNLLTNFL